MIPAKVFPFGVRVTAKSAALPCVKVEVSGLIAGVPITGVTSIVNTGLFATPKSKVSAFGPAARLSR